MSGSPAQYKERLSLKIKVLLLVAEERPTPHQDQWEDQSAFWGAANELCLIFMKLHGKLLIRARNESVELDRLMNIHPGLQHTGVDQW